MGIKEARTTLGWTKERLGYEIGVPARTISDWEENLNCPKYVEDFVMKRIENLQNLKKGRI
jgi:DNA-binding XRE family transcriptional regulator